MGKQWLTFSNLINYSLVLCLLICLTLMRAFTRLRSHEINDKCNCKFCFLFYTACTRNKSSHATRIVTKSASHLVLPCKPKQATFKPTAGGGGGGVARQVSPFTTLYQPAHQICRNHAHQSPGITMHMTPR